MKQSTHDLAGRAWLLLQDSPILKMHLSAPLSIPPLRIRARDFVSTVRIVVAVHEAPGIRAKVGKTSEGPTGMSADRSCFELRDSRRRASSSQLESSAPPYFSPPRLAFSRQNFNQELRRCSFGPFGDFPMASRNHAGPQAVQFRPPPQTPAKLVSYLELFEFQPYEAYEEWSSFLDAIGAAKTTALNYADIRLQRIRRDRQAHGNDLYRPVWDRALEAVAREVRRRERTELVVRRPPRHGSFACGLGC